MVVPDLAATTSLDVVDVVFFDAAGTLFDVRGSVGEIYCRCAREFDVRCDAEEIQARFSTAFKRKPPMAFSEAPLGETRRMERSWWEELVFDVFEHRMSTSVFDSFFDRVYETFRGSDAWALFPETLGVLEKLCERRYRIGVISNFDSRLTEVLAALRVEPFIEHTVLSSLVGVAKPDPRIFRIAADSMGVSPARALHVGDSLDHDVVGARNAGLKAFLIDRQDRYPCLSDSRLRSLSELCDMLAAPSR